MDRVHTEIEVIRTLAKRVKSPYALLFNNVTVAGLQSAIDAFKIGDYTDSATLSRDYLLHTYLKKWVGYTVPGRKERTLQSWLDAEELCFKTNQRLNSVTDSHWSYPWISEIRKRIVDVIGHAPGKGIFSQCAWSGGATYATKRGASPGKKNSVEKTVTHAASYSAPWLMAGLAGSNHDYLVVPGNRAWEVPKTAKINRMIAIEPSANIFVQQSVGKFLRRRLQRVGIDLDDQSRNQDAAFRALVDGLATLDLEMASDTLSVSCVQLLLPPAWFNLLCELRSERTLINGRWRWLEKFSSMGNGFNFELETLIFWAASSCFYDHVLVYGDDIVTAASAVDDTIALLTFLGFKINKSKSFTAPSRFYESCGKHYFDLDDVTPAYQKEKLTTRRSLILAHNRLYRWALRTKNMKYVLNALAILRKKCDKLDTDGTQPIGFTIGDSDVAFLADDSLLLRDKHGDVIVNGALIEVPRLADPDVEDEYALWYKLYAFQNLNPDPKGWTALVKQPLTRYKRRAKVWVSGASQTTLKQ